MRIRKIGVISRPYRNINRILNEHYMDKIKMAPANLATIKVHTLTLICLIIGYIATGAVL